MLQKIFISRNQKFPDRKNKENKIKDRVHYIWKCLCKEYGLIEGYTPLIITNTKEYPNEVARRLAILGYNTDVDSSAQALRGTNKVPIMMTSYHIDMDESNRTLPVLTGVFVMWDHIYPYMVNDNETEIDVKLRCIECKLRHEIGHVISMKRLFGGLTIDQYNSLDESIMMQNDEIKKSWHQHMTNEEWYRSYFTLPVESLANETAGITVDMLIDADDLLKS